MIKIFEIHPSKIKCYRHELVCRIRFGNITNNKENEPFMLPYVFTETKTRAVHWIPLAKTFDLFDSFVIYLINYGLFCSISVQ